MTAAGAPGTGNRLRALRMISGMVFRADPLRATAGLVLLIALFAADLVMALSLKALTDAAVRGDRDGALVAGIVLAALVVSQFVAKWGDLGLHMGLRERTTLFFDTRMATLAATIPTLDHHERPEYLDEMEVLRQHHQTLAGTHEALVVNISAIVRFASTVTVLATISPLLVLLPLFAVPSVWAAVRGERLRQQVQDVVAWRRRLDIRLFQLAATADAGKELRVFGLQDELLGRYDAAVAEADRIEDAAGWKAATWSAAGWLVFGAGFVAALTLVGRMAVRGEATPGDLVLAFTLAASVNYGAGGLARSVGWLLRNLKMGARFVWLHDYAAEADARARADDPAPVPAALADGIRFEGVGFRYPGGEVDILADVDLHLPAGATVAIVGENGAGKTTLVKLLCRFYDPTAGRITVDGVDLRRLDVGEWRERVAAGFQDFGRFELVASEAVGVGDLPRLDDHAAVGAALERASAADVVAGLPSGLASQLGRSFEGGADLSTGQWQKLALGRAMMREHPLLLVLDEPTAALDPGTEHALFERYSGAARRAAGGTGAISLLVSHRFSTVRMADLIVVVAGGRVVEVGTHAELVARDGLYAELYGLQSRAYR